MQRQIRYFMNYDQQLNVLLVDEDPVHSSRIQEYIKKSTSLNLVGLRASPLLDIDKVDRLKPDLIIADLTEYNKSKIKIINESFPNQVQIVGTSLNGEMALDGFNLDITDFIMKSSSYERFKEAIRKVRRFYHYKKLLTLEDIIKREDSSPNNIEQVNQPFIWIKVDKKIMHVRKTEIVYIECLRDFVRIHLLRKNYVTSITMTTMEQELGGMDFIRVNRSFIVNLNFIECIYGNVIETSIGKMIPIGSNYRNLIKQLYS